LWKTFDSIKERAQPGWAASSVDWGARWPVALGVQPVVFAVAVARVQRVQQLQE